MEDLHWLLFSHVLCQFLFHAISNRLGISVSRFAPFVFEFETQTNSWNVIIPNSRKEDISREIDLIEEIARLHGFNNFVSYLPIIKEIGIEDFSYQSRKKLITCFLSEGLNELIQYSLVKEQINQQNPIKLVNPLISDCSTLRRSLLPNIIETISENLKQGNRNIEGY